MSHVLRIDVKRSVQWGCGSDILLIGVDCVKQADSCLRRIFVFIATCYDQVLKYYFAPRF
jgi:hypothetical protein